MVLLWQAGRMRKLKFRFKRKLRACLLWAAIPMTVLSRNADIRLPESAGAWILSETRKRVNEKTIFEYMDGAGEMYLGFRFDGLDVFTYQAPGREDILVERYRMRSPDDAFGLLSMDWSGEPVSSGDAPGEYPRCLYAAGLLRIWSGSLYVRIMTFPETPESREAVMKIGGAFIADRGTSRPPFLLNALPPVFSGGWEPDRDKTGFLRSHLVLNSFYFVSFSNILNLDPQCEAVCARYRPSPRNPEAKSFFLLIIRYPEVKRAASGVRSFTESFYPEIDSESDMNGSSENRMIIQTESGWSGCAVRGRTAVLGFEWPSEAAGRVILKEAVDHQKTMEENNGP